jgi:hypothetical protein
VLAILALFLCLFAPGADLDRDGFGGCEERAHGCDPFNGESFPVCGDLDGDGVGEWPLIAPRCEMAEGLAPCA